MSSKKVICEIKRQNGENMENKDTTQKDQMNGKKRNNEQMELSSTGFGFVPKASNTTRENKQRSNDGED